MQKFNTVEEVAQHFYQNLNEEDKEAVANGFAKFAPFEQVLVHMDIKRAIRNIYNLWHNSPLTEKWRTDESSHKMIDGVDHSEDHPDNISQTIYNRVVELAIEAKGR